MSVNPYTLQQLYANGIIEYIPDLGQSGMGTMNAMQNPYLNMAMSGARFQNYNAGQDSFTMSNPQLAYNTQIGSQSIAGRNMFGLSGIGTQSSTSLSNLYGFNGIGNESVTGLSNIYGQSGIGYESNTNLSNALGGFTDISNGFKRTIATVTSAPDIVKGLGALGIIIGTISLLKGKKKPKVKQGFFARLNPFKKKTKALPKPEKSSFFSRINPFKTKSKNK